MTRIAKTTLDNFLASKQRKQEASEVFQQRANERTAAQLNLRKLIDEHGGDSKAIIIDNQMIQLVDNSIFVYRIPQVIK